eukprot:gene8503-17536_t
MPNAVVVECLDCNRIAEGKTNLEAMRPRWGEGVRNESSRSQSDKDPYVGIGRKENDRDRDRKYDSSDRQKERDRRRDHRSRSRSRSTGRSRRSRSRSRSRDRKSSKYESSSTKNGDSGRSNVRKNSNDSKKSNTSVTLKKDEISLIAEDDDKIDEATLKGLEKFADEEEYDEEKESERLIQERKRRREEILRKHQEAEITKIGSPRHINGNITDILSESNIDESEDILPTEIKILSPKNPNNHNHLINIYEDHNNYQDSLSNNNNNTNNKIMNGADELAAERDAIAAAERKETALFDIFSSSPSDKELFTKYGNGNKRASKTALLEGEDPHLQSNWDDGEGYYKPRIGELIAERYETRGVVGKGVFSTVLLCIDTKFENNMVAVKMIRSNDIMRKAAEKEVQLLLEIASTDPDNKKHCVRLLQHLEYRNHVTMVFEPLQMNLRETIKKFGKNVGINITAVRMYAKQLLFALKHLYDLKIVHADIKPDNILVSDDLKQVKLCDFGSAFKITDTDNDPTPYLISRFYRAPEVILGLLYDHMIDLWSIGVCFYELFTGHVMFPGRTNNDMLKLMMEVKGRFPNKMLRAHLRSYENMQLEPHFQEDLRFRQQEQDPVT